LGQCVYTGIANSSYDIVIWWYHYLTKTLCYVSVAICCCDVNFLTRSIIAKGDVRWMTKSVNLICRQKHPTKICRVSCKNRSILLADNFVGQQNRAIFARHFVGRLFVYQTTNFVYVAMVIVYNGRWIFILVIYCVCYLFSFIRCRKSDASIILRFALCCCASWYRTK